MLTDYMSANKEHKLKQSDKTGLSKLEPQQICYSELPKEQERKKLKIRSVEITKE